MLSDCLTSHSYARSRILPWPYARSRHQAISRQTTIWRSHRASQLAKLPTNNNVPRGGATARSTYVSSGTEEERALQTRGHPTTRAEKQTRQPSEPSVSDRHTVTPPHRPSSLPASKSKLLLLRACPCLRPNGLECSKAEGAEGPSSCGRMSRMSTK